MHLLTQNCEQPPATDFMHLLIFDASCIMGDNTLGVAIPEAGCAFTQFAIMQKWSRELEKNEASALPTGENTPTNYISFGCSIPVLSIGGGRQKFV